MRARAGLSSLAVVLLGCGDGGGGGPGQLGDGGIRPPRPSCAAAGGGAAVAAPALEATLSADGREAWLGSPALADLDGDGAFEIVAPRDGSVVVWRADGTVVGQALTDGRIWAPPVVGDLVPDRPGLEIAAAARGVVHVWSADLEELPGFPAAFRDELRALAAGDVDGDGALELVAVTTSDLDSGGQTDILVAFELDGSRVAGFPPNTTGASGCDDQCFVHAGFDQTLALGDVDGDGIDDILVPQDNAYLSLHDGTGRAFDAAPIFDRLKVHGVRGMIDYGLAQQGFGDDGDEQSHHTNSAPALADVDGDGVAELVILGSVQNVAQDDRERGVVLFVYEPDMTRPAAWVAPYRAPDFLAGLFDFDGTNVVAATNQVSAVDLDPDRAGPEFVFAGFDGRIHAVDAANQAMWSVGYTTDDRVLTGGVVVADLSADGAPELVFATYSPDPDKGALIVLDGGGNELHRIALPGRGAMPVPSVGDVDGDGELEIVVSLKDGDDGEVLIYGVAGSGTACLPWPTGRGNLLRSGYLPPEGA